MESTPVALLPGDHPQPGVFGPGSLAELPNSIRRLGLERVLLLTGANSFRASGADRIVPALRETSQVEVWSDFSPNTDVDDLVRGLHVAQAFKPDGVVAVGGGSALDMAKLIAAFLATDPDDVPDAVRTNRLGHRAPALILVPTTSGSGSEATHFAVAYIGEDKYSVAHPSLIPDFVIIDEELTLSASAHQKATSAIDAVAQAVESFWATGATDASRTFARDALGHLIPSVAAFVAGDNSAAAEAARGSHLAGRAINVSKTTGAHAMAYGLTRRHGISHGHAVATTLGEFARRHAEVALASGSGGELAQTMAELAELVGADGPLGVGSRLDLLATDLGLELRLESLGVPRSELPNLAGAVNVERLGNNPVGFTTDELRALLESCW
jgi:alcohol dehydrogenase class IV